MKPTPFIIIPCYNEGVVLRSTLESLIEAGYNQIVVVDDGSLTPVQSLVGDLPVHILRHAVNLGQGAALETGMEYARRHQASAVVHFDADGQHDFREISAFLEALKEADMVLGSRFLEGGSQVPWARRCLLRMARCVNFIFCGIWLTDAHNGFRALGPKALQAIHLKENRMAHATEIVMQAKNQGLKIQEIPVHIRYTDYSRSKGQKWYNSINILLDLLLNRIL